MSALSFYTGDRNTDTIDAVDFVKECNIYFRKNKVTDEAIMLKEAGDHFRNRSNADRWFKTKEVKDGINGSWDAFVIAFQERFEGIYPKEKPTVQLIAELSGMRISLGDLAQEYVMVGGEKYAPMEDFLARLKDAVSAANANKARDGVFQFHADLPAQLRAAVGDSPADWGTMIAALQAIPQTTIKTAVEEYKMRTAMERNIADIQRRLAATQLGVHVAPVVVAPRAPVVAPAVAPVVTPRTPVVAPVHAPVGPAVQEAARGPRRGGAGREGTEAEKAALRAVLAECVRQRAPNTPEGMVRYQAQLAAWRAVNPGEERLIAIETSGYPLQPGTADPCSAECWRCGFVVRPVHGQACPGPFVPDLERRFRMVCGQWLGRTQTPAAANYVEEIVAGVPCRRRGFCRGGALIGQRAAPRPGLIGGAGSPSCTSLHAQNLQLVDLYLTETPARDPSSAPFVHWIAFRSEKGETVRAMALFDGGAQVGAIDSSYFEKVRRRMGRINPPTKRLKMADGSIVASVANWEGEIEIEGVCARGEFEVFDSGGGWKVLFGKPLQATMGVVHDMRRDVVTLSVGSRSAVL
ncbi:hypothetical protein DFH06DRAFT_992350, partial [Mycena polygramma]